MQWKDSGGSEFEQAPVGSHIARCVKLIDIGTQQSEYQGKATYKRQVIIGWELPNALMTEGEYAGKPFTVSKFYTASLSEKANLRKDMENWRGKTFTDQELMGFDSKNILDKGCMVSVTLNEKNKARVTGVMALPKGVPLPDRVSELVYFSLERSDFNPAVFESLSEGYKKMIRLSPEYQELTKPGSHQAASGGIGNFEDDVPFMDPYKFAWRAI